MACLIQAGTCGLLTNLIISLVNAVWGVLTWVNLTEECTAFYDGEYSSLIWLFKIYVVTLLVLCLACIVGGYYGVHAQREGYEPVPEGDGEKNA